MTRRDQLALLSLGAAVLTLGGCTPCFQVTGLDLQETPYYRDHLKQHFDMTWAMQRFAREHGPQVYVRMENDARHDHCSRPLRVAPDVWAINGELAVQEGTRNVSVPMGGRVFTSIKRFSMDVSLGEDPFERIYQEVRELVQREGGNVAEVHHAGPRAHGPGGGQHSFLHRQGLGGMRCR